MGSRFLLALTILASTAASAQFITVSGAAQDNVGLPYANGTITPTLTISGSPTLNGAPYTPPSQPFGLDVNGNFSFNLAPNSALSPSGSTWSFTVCSGSGTVSLAWGRQSVCFQALNITLNSSRDISGELITKAQPLTYSGSFLAASSATSCPIVNGLVEWDFAHLDPSGKATVKVAAPSSQVAAGFAVFVPGAQCQGNSQVATGLVVPCLTANQSAAGDFVTSSTIAGECMDYGSTQSTSVKTYGQVVRGNSGAGTISMIYVGPFLNGGAGGGAAPGTVTLVSSGNLTGSISVAGTAGTSNNTIFTTSVSNSTTTPQITFEINPGVAPGSFFGQPLQGFRQPGFFQLSSTGTDVTLAGAGTTGNLNLLALRFGGVYQNASAGTRIPMSATPPTAGQVLGYDGTSIVGMNLPTAGTASVIAKGTVVIPANSPIPALGCVGPFTSPSPGVTVNDVISWSFSNAPGLAFPASSLSGVTFNAYADFNGTVSFDMCNGRSTDLNTPTADMHILWQVIR